jgi:hypothetical protein
VLNRKLQPHAPAIPWALLPAPTPLRPPAAAAAAAAADRPPAPPATPQPPLRCACRLPAFCASAAAAAAASAAAAAALSSRGHGHARPTPRVPLTALAASSMSWIVATSCCTAACVRCAYVSLRVAGWSGARSCGCSVLRGRLPSSALSAAMLVGWNVMACSAPAAPPLLPGLTGAAPACVASGKWPSRCSGAYSGDP